MLRTTAIFGVCVLLGLSACGGGGSSSAPQSQQSSVVSSVNVGSSSSVSSVVNSSSSLSNSTAISSLSASSISSASGSFISSSLTSLASSSASSTATSAVAKPQTIGVSLSGLTGTGLVLTNNGGDDLPLSRNGKFRFEQTLNSGTTYAVAIKTQPEGQTCTIANGSGTVTNSNNIIVTCVSPSMEIFAGEVGRSGYVDATTASAAFFANPSAVAIDTTGNVYVADTSNNAIRKITPAGVVTTLAGGDGAGFSDGTGKAAKFSSPSGLVVDKNGNLFVADSSNHAIRKITSAGVVTTVAGSGIAGLTNATGAAAAFNQPKGIALDSSGNLYVADFANNVIRKITPTGVVTTFAGSGLRGALNGVGTAAQFNSPAAITTDTSGNLFLADKDSHAIRKITPAGVVTSFAGSTTGLSGNAEGTADAARFTFPEGIAVDAIGNLYVADTGNHVIRKITQAAQVTTFAGGFTDIRRDINGFVNASGRLAQFNHPAGVAVDATGNLLVADTFNSVIRKVTPAGVVSTSAGSGEQGFTDGLGAAAKFQEPTGVVGDASGNLYLADSGNNAIRKLSAAGLVSIVAGNGTEGLVDGTGAAARFASPKRLVIDSQGNVFVLDSLNRAIRKMTPVGAVSTFAGGTFGFTDGTGATAQFGILRGIAIDALDNMFVVDESNNAIRKVTSAGVVTTLAGGARGFVDGEGRSASFNFPIGITIDRAGNLFVVDSDNHAIRKITPSGQVTTFAGGIRGFADGVGASARFQDPIHIAIDPSDNLYVSDSSNNCIRKITPASVVTTVIGQQGKRGFVAGDLPGVIGNVSGMTFVGNTLYFTQGNGIVKVSNLP